MKNRRPLSSTTLAIWALAGFPQSAKYTQTGTSAEDRAFRHHGPGKAHKTSLEYSRNTTVWSVGSR